MNSPRLRDFGIYYPSRTDARVVWFQPTGEWDHATFCITNYLGLVASSLTAKEIPFAKSLSYPLSVLLFFTDPFKKRRIGKNRKQIDVQFCSSFDDRFDAFWEELTCIRAQMLLGTTDARNPGLAL
jgi:hypothetical protein